MQLEFYMAGEIKKFLLTIGDRTIELDGERIKEDSYVLHVLCDIIKGEYGVSGQLNAILQLANFGANISTYINMYNKEGYNLLHIAAQENNIEIGKYLIEECGVNIESTSKTNVGGDTPLHLAGRKGHKYFAELLLDKKANVNAVSSTGSEVTPLHDVAYSGHVDVAELLIDRGAKVDAGDRHNYTPLILASANGKSEMVKLLLERKADLYLQNKNGETALHDAVGNGNLNVVSALLGAAENKAKYVNTQNNSLGTALHIIAHKTKINDEHKKIIKLLLDNGSDLYIKNNQDKDLIDIAIERDNIEFIKSLIKCEKDLIKDKKTETFLHKAVEEGKIDRVELLIQNGTNINARNEKGLTPLDLAIQKKDKNITQSLKENGAKTSLVLKIQLAALIILTIFTLGLALVIYNIVKSIQKIQNGKESSPDLIKVQRYSEEDQISY